MLTYAAYHTTSSISHPNFCHLVSPLDDTQKQNGEERYRKRRNSDTSSIRRIYFPTTITLMYWLTSPCNLNLMSKTSGYAHVEASLRYQEASATGLRLSTFGNASNEEFDCEVKRYGLLLRNRTVLTLVQMLAPLVFGLDNFWTTLPAIRTMLSASPKRRSGRSYGIPDLMRSAFIAQTSDVDVVTTTLDIANRACRMRCWCMHSCTGLRVERLGALILHECIWCLSHRRPTKHHTIRACRVWLSVIASRRNNVHDDAAQASSLTIICIPLDISKYSQRQALELVEEVKWRMSYSPGLRVASLRASGPPF